MSKYENCIGKKYGSLTCLRFSRKNKFGQDYYLFRCDCGKEKEFLINNVIRGLTTRCSSHKEDVMKTDMENLDGEIWKDIKGYEGYQVSNFGRVRTINKVSQRLVNGKMRNVEWQQRVLKTKGANYGIGYRVDLWKDGKPKTMLVARLVAYTFFNEDFTDLTLTVNHIDGNRFNNHINNLEIVSTKDNINHAFDTGLHSNSKYIRLYSKDLGTTKVFRSMSRASEFLQHNNHYITSEIKKGRFENKDFKWELISKEEYLNERNI